MGGPRGVEVLAFPTVRCLCRAKKMRKARRGRSLAVLVTAASTILFLSGMSPTESEPQQVFCAFQAGAERRVEAYRVQIPAGLDGEVALNAVLAMESECTLGVFRLGVPRLRLMEAINADCN